MYIYNFCGCLRLKVIYIIFEFDQAPKKGEIKKTRKREKGDYNYY